ncbi:MAG: TolC family protein, partial [Bacteroidales bacterium]|nr:TolC family protein [Bacteroidales bacterium]
LLLLLPASLVGQDTLTLSGCLDGVMQYAPRRGDRELIGEQGRLKVDNVKTFRYPELTLNGKISYQSDVVSIEIDQPGMTFTFPEMPHEQYGLNLDIRQTIYDGGLTRQKQVYERAATAAAMQQVDVDLYALRDQAAQLYFSILLMQETRNNLEIVLENLQSREKILLAAVTHGVAEKSDLEVIHVEILKTLQSISETDAGRSGLLERLGVFLGSEVNDDVVLLRPYLEMEVSDRLERPEIEWFELQSDMIDAGKELTAVQRMPRLFAFGQAGMGKPGYNLLNDGLDSYYMVGAGIQWQVWDWNSVKREKQIMELKKQVIHHSRETFAMNVRAGMKQQVKALDYLKKTVSLDDRILEMRIGITANAAAKMENGVITATEYLQVLNEEKQVRIRRSTHQLQMLKAMANYQILNGTL